MQRKVSHLSVIAVSNGYILTLIPEILCQLGHEIISGASWRISPYF